MSAFRSFAAASALAAVITGCKENTGPAWAGPGISGEWVFREYAGPEDVCDAAGAFVFSQTRATFSGTARRYTGGCPPTPAAVNVVDGQVSDTGITFTFGLCPYTGTFKGARRDSLAGTFFCTPSSGTGTWAAARAAPAASLTLGLAARIMVLGGTTGLGAVLTDGAGHPLYGRPITWSSDNPAVVTVTTSGATTALVTGVSPGSAKITATSAGFSASAQFIVRIVRFAAVGASFAETCGVSVGGDAYCWGAGQGSGSSTPVGVSGSVAFSSLSKGDAYACGVTTGGAAYCWGFNVSGQLGNGSTVSSSTPVAVLGGLTFAAVSAGVGHTCGVTTGGAAYCWGYNVAGELGIGVADTLPHTTPVAVANGLTFAAVSAGPGFTCGVTTSGAAYCWGVNGSGQLGDGAADTVLHSTPVAVAGGLSFATVSAGYAHTCGVTSGGAAYCWGNNYGGYLGDGSTTNSSTPVAVVGGLTFAAVSAGDDHTCGVTTSGAAHCWGFNDYGQLGNGAADRLPHTNPVAVAGALAFAEVSAGSGHTCGVTTGGAAYCWGWNSYGQLGNGAMANSATPVVVTGQ
jgi:hypothetical protein